MEQERWRRVEALYHSALEQPLEYRAAFLKEACSDPELRQEVEGLLAQPGDGILDHPVAQVVAGVRLGPYEIRRVIGVGGMGQVFEARDSRLGRSVAIKICSAEFASRFAREAQAISALNHPNICTLYDVGPNYLVMELVEGPTLAERIKQGPLPLEEALAIAKQIAEAVEAAHEKGIVHRDLKPANIKIRPDGTVKVLDFGLARVIEANASERDDVETATKSGIILGTPRYMAPEQARGQRADQRVDIWAFGVVLWEMVTGRSLFKGDTESDTLASVLKTEPVWEQAPPEWRSLLKACLVKDPGQRLRSIGDALRLVDVRLAPKDLKEESESGTLAGAPPAKAAKHFRIPWSAVIALLLAVAAAAYWSSRRDTATPAPLQAIPLTTYPGQELDPSLSPDGNQVAFSWDGDKQDNLDIYVKLIASGRPLRLTTDPGRDTAPAWSPDGASIAFMRLSRYSVSLMLVPALGGAERQVAEWPRVDPSVKPGVNTRSELGGTVPWVRWSPDGRWLVTFALDATGKRLALWLISPESGEERQLTTPPAGCLGDTFGAISPDGRSVAFIRLTASLTGDVYIMPLASNSSAGGDPRRLTNENRRMAGLAWTADSREIVFSSDRGGPWALWRVAISGSTEVRRLGIGENGLYPSISRRGDRLVYSQFIVDNNIWRVDLTDPHRPPTEWIASTRNDLLAQYSPDGKRIVFSSNRSGNDELWVCDADGSNPAQLLSMGFSSSARWSPDSRWIAFDSNVEGHYQIYVVGVQGGRPRRMTTAAANDARASWSSDGKWIYFDSDRGTGGPSWQVWKMPAGGGEPLQVTQHGGANPLESPDGTMLYYTRRENGTQPLYRMHPGGGDETKVLDSVSSRAFTVTARGIYFVSEGRLQYHDLATGISRTILRTEKPLPRYTLSVSPDERWLLYTQTDQSGSDLMRVDNFR